VVNIVCQQMNKYHLGVQTQKTQSLMTQTTFVRNVGPLKKHIGLNLLMRVVDVAIGRNLGQNKKRQRNVGWFGLVQIV
jgi:hypothetical protein